MKTLTYFYNTFFPALLISAFLPSCKRLIEIPPNPPTAITETQQFADSADAMTAIAGIYTYAANGRGGFAFNDGLLSSATGLSSDELVITNTQDPGSLELYNNNINVNNGIVARMWADPYTGLYSVNTALANIATSAGLSVSFKKQLTAELKVVRALYYFYLVNLFDAVPLITETNYNVTTRQPRVSTDSVYSFILGDLTEASQNLSVDYPSGARYRPNTNVASAFLSKVYLYRKEWQKSYDAANAVISSNMYSLETDLNRVFLDGNTEAVWQLPGTAPYTGTTEAQHFVPYASGVVPNYVFTQVLTDAFEAGDLRLQQWAAQTVINSGGTDQTFYYPFKYKLASPSTSDPMEDFSIFRLSELYLIRAEASLQLGDAGTAISDINTVRARAGLPPTTASTPDDVMKAILHERQTELFCEWGNRWMDLKRTGTIDAVLGAEKPNWDAHDALYPVPNKERNLNGQLSQNPGY